MFIIHFVQAREVMLPTPLITLSLNPNPSRALH